MANGIHILRDWLLVLNDGVFFQSSGELENAALFLFINNTGLSGGQFTGSALQMNGTQVKMPVRAVINTTSILTPNGLVNHSKP